MTIAMLVLVIWDLHLPVVPFVPGSFMPVTKLNGVVSRMKTQVSAIGLISTPLKFISPKLKPGPRGKDLNKHHTFSCPSSHLSHSQHVDGLVHPPQ